MSRDRSLPVLQSFPAVADARARLLILGSMPGARSLREQQYYAHPQNAFWRLMGRVLEADPALAYADRLNILQNNRIALWDVLKHCQRSGSLDSAIQSDSIVINEFDALFQRCPLIRRVLFNGKKAEQLFRRHVLPTIKLGADVECIGLPSTSPAHATITFEQKLALWREALTLPE